MSISFHFISLYSIYISLSSYIHLPFYLRPAINEFEDSQTDRSEFSLDKIAGEVDDKEVDDFDLSPDLLRLIEHEEEHFMPHNEVTKLIDLGIEENKGEVQIRLDWKIVAHSLPTRP